MYEPADNGTRLSSAIEPVPEQTDVFDKHIAEARLASLGPTVPKFILVIWMGAASRHSLKYVAGYQILFPAFRLLLIRSSAIDMF